MKKQIIIGALIGSMALGGAALAGGPGHGGGFGFPGFGKIFHKLDLTDQQQELAVEIKQGLKQKARALHQQRISTRAEIAAELAKPNPDAAKLHALADQRAEEMKKLAHEGIDQFLRLHATLSDEQRQELVQELQKKGEKHHKMRRRE